MDLFLKFCRHGLDYTLVAIGIGEQGCHLLGHGVHLEGGKHAVALPMISLHNIILPASKGHCDYNQYGIARTNYIMNQKKTKQQ